MTVVEKSKTDAKLPLNSLEIKGYRAFKELTIPKLARVNLITGKNNVGKTSLLEAISLYARRGSPGAVWDVLSSRETALVSSAVREYPDLWNEILRMFYGASLALNFASDGAVTWSASIGDALEEDFLQIGSFKPNPDTDISVGIYTQFRSEEDATFRAHLTYSLRRIIDLNRQIWDRKDSIKCLFVGGRIGLREHWGELWDNIALAQSAQDVVNGLRAIEPRVEAIALFGDPGIGLGRIPNLRITDDDTRHSLSEFGDGMYRLFDILVALVNVKDGILIVDEIENGLHYSVLIKIWKTIFEVAKRLNVQVFATTHSWECVEAFQQAAGENEAVDGALIRLQNKNGDITATVFDERRLAIATRDQIEVR